jgi:hypothetical protein
VPTAKWCAMTAFTPRAAHGPALMPIASENPSAQNYSHAC